MTTQGEQILQELARLVESLPKDPIAKENRGKSRLFPSRWVVRGMVYRLVPQPELVGHDKPLIVMNTEDVDMLRWEFCSGHRAIPFGDEFIDQEIADCCEQLFADREAAKK